ncbi:hypothetical protein [Prochlorococcus marinus]|uniref:hypothetical protein n=1 Tax=Prochlorococcus marinus TaxID=1219 RepID=UPI0022B46A5E|nr:hypothetical protein [Prochlorococcus marinus]
MTTVIIGTSNFYPIMSQSEHYEPMMYLSKECFAKRNKKVCKKALNKIQLYKSLENLKDNYSCQTRLLGLEAQLIMVIMKMTEERGLSLGMLRDLQKNCSF